MLEERAQLLDAQFEPTERVLLSNLATMKGLELALYAISESDISYTARLAEQAAAPDLRAQMDQLVSDYQLHFAQHKGLRQPAF